MLCELRSKVGKSALEQHNAFPLHPHGDDQQREQPREIIIACGRRIEESEPLLDQRSQRGEAQPRIDLSPQGHADDHYDGGGIHRRHDVGLGWSRKPSAELPHGATDMLAAEVEMDELRQSGSISRRRHDQRSGMGGGRGKQHQDPPIEPIVQRRCEDRQKADAEPAQARKLLLTERGDAGARQQDSCEGRDIGAHQQRECNENASAPRDSEGRARPLGVASDQKSKARQKKDIGGGIGEPARRPFDILHEAGAEEHADRNGDKNERHAHGPFRRQKPPEHDPDQKGQQENKREIAEIRLAEHGVLDHA